MLTKVEVRTLSGSLLILPLEDISEGLLITKIEGLDPVKAELVSSTYATRDGEDFQSARRGVRNIVFEIALEPDYSVSTVRDLRNQVYGYFMPKTWVNLRFFTVDDHEYDIMGQVETCESEIFSEEPTVSVSVLCYDPDFFDFTPVELEGDTVEDSTEMAVEYLGTSETGVKITLAVDREISDFTVYHRTPTDELRIFEFAAALEAGDVVVLNSVPGEKAVTLTRLGVTTSVLYGMSAQSKWPLLAPGTNHIRVYVEGDDMPYTIEYTTKYGGL